MKQKKSVLCLGWCWGRDKGTSTKHKTNNENLASGRNQSPRWQDEAKLPGHVQNSWDRCWIFPEGVRWPFLRAAGNIWIVLLLGRTMSLSCVSHHASAGTSTNLLGRTYECVMNNLQQWDEIPAPNYWTGNQRLPRGPQVWNTGTAPRAHERVIAPRLQIQRLLARNVFPVSLLKMEMPTITDLKVDLRR